MNSNNQHEPVSNNQHEPDSNNEPYSNNDTCYEYYCDSIGSCTTYTKQELLNIICFEHDENVESHRKIMSQREVYGIYRMPSRNVTWSYSLVHFCDLPFWDNVEFCKYMILNKVCNIAQFADKITCNDSLVVRELMNVGRLDIIRRNMKIPVNDSNDSTFKLYEMAVKKNKNNKQYIAFEQLGLPYDIFDGKSDDESDDESNNESSDDSNDDSNDKSDDKYAELNVESSKQHDIVTQSNTKPNNNPYFDAFKQSTDDSLRKHHASYNKSINSSNITICKVEEVKVEVEEVKVEADKVKVDATEIVYKKWQLLNDSISNIFDIERPTYSMLLYVFSKCKSPSKYLYLIDSLEHKNDRENLFNIIKNFTYTKVYYDGTDNRYHEKNTQNCAKTIKKYLKDVDNANGKKNKKAISIKLYEFLIQNKWFVDDNFKFKVTVIKKLKEFKQCNDYTEYEAMYFLHKLS